MSDPQRPKREDPERTGPNRAWAGLYRAAEPAGSTSAPSSIGAWSDVVTEGVELGYRVIEEQIRQGQRVAQQINTRSYGPGVMTNDVREMSERVLDYYTTMASLWFKFIASLAGVADPARGLESAPSPRPPTGTGTSIEIISSRPTHVQLELRPQSENLTLTTPELRALSAANPPLRDVAFERGGADRPMRLRIRVPAGQPPDTYYGVVVDAESGRAQGTISLRVE